MVALLETPESIVNSWLRSLRSKATLKHYSRWISYVLGSDERVHEFLILADSNRFRAEQFLIDWISQNRERLAGDSLHDYLAPAKSLLNYAGIQLNWKKVMSSCTSRSRSRDTLPRLSDIQTLLSQMDLRFRVIVLMMLSGGFRVGAFDYFTYRDVSEFVLKDGRKIGRLVVYRGEAEQYITFLTDECMDSLREYIAFRARAGEILSPASPLIRTSFDPRFRDRPPRKLGSGSLMTFMADAWKRIGLQGGRRTFKQDHGFRKYFKSQLIKAGMRSYYVELLKGSYDRYYRGENFKMEGSRTGEPTDEELAEEYGRFCHALYIDPRYMAERKARETEADKSKIERDVMMELRILRQENREMRESFQRIKDAWERSREKV